MTPFEILGLIFGCGALFFAIVTGLTYFRIKKFISLIDEEMYEQAIPIIEKQRRRIYAYVVLSCIFTVLTLVFSIIS